MLLQRVASITSAVTTSSKLAILPTGATATAVDSAAVPNCVPLIWLV
jgi:hypothetical protein